MPIDKPSFRFDLIRSVSGRYEREFSGAGEPLAQGRERLSPPVDVVVLASESLRRKSAVEFALQGRRVIALPGGKEPPFAETMETARLKIENALYLANRSDQIRTGDRVAIIAADVLSRPAGENKSRVSVTKRKGKPNGLDDVRMTFAEMARLYDDRGIEPYYLVTAGSGIKFVPQENRRPIFLPSSSTVSLDPEIVRYFGTEEGIRQYESEFEDFHRSEAYLNLGHHKPVNFSDAAGGFSGPVLMQMGAITGVDSVPTNEPNFAEHYRNYLYVSFVGIHPAVLETLEPNAGERLRNWPFLNEVARQTMADRGLGT